MSEDTDVIEDDEYADTNTNSAGAHTMNDVENVLNTDNNTVRTDHSDPIINDSDEDEINYISQAPLRLQVRLSIWASNMRDTILESSEIDRWGTVISLVLFIMIASVAFQFLMMFLGSGVWWLLLGGKTPPTFSDMTDPDDIRKTTEFIVLMGPLASALAYAPILFFVPFIKEKISKNPWIRLPWKLDRTNDDCPSHDLDHAPARNRLISAVLVPLKTIGLVLLFLLIGIVLVMLMQVIGAVFQWLGIESGTVEDTPSSTITITNAALGFMNGTAVFPLWTVLTLIIAIIIMPIIEEVVFRGLVLSELLSSSFAYKIIDMPAVGTAHDNADSDSPVDSDDDRSTVHNVDTVDSVDTGNDEHSDDDEHSDVDRVRTKPRTAAMMIISGFFFSMIHIPGAVNIPLAIVSMTVFGSLLAALDWVWRPRSIWPGVAAHIAYNAITLSLSALVVAGLL